MSRLLGVMIPFSVFVSLAMAMVALIQLSTGTSIVQLSMPQPSIQR